MLKLFFCIMAIAIGAYIGYIKSEDYKKRVMQLNDCELFLLRLKTYMAASKLQTKELFKALSDTKSLSSLTFIQSTAKCLESSPNFPIVFRECIQNSKAGLSLKEEDYIPILTLSELIGSYDTQEVLNGIELSKQLIGQSKEKAEQLYKTNGKLSRSLGLLAGIAVAILIL